MTISIGTIINSYMTISIGIIINININIDIDIDIHIDIDIDIDIIILISAGLFKDAYHTNLYFTSANLTISFDLSSFFSL